MWRALALNAGTFGALFGLHIVFATLDWELAFSLVAVSISAQTVCFGPLTVVLEGAVDRAQRRRTNRAAAVVAFPLALGLAWAYGGMAWSLTSLVVVLGLTVSVHLALDRRLALTHDA